VCVSLDARVCQKVFDAAVLLFLHHDGLPLALPKLYYCQEGLCPDEKMVRLKVRVCVCVCVCVCV